MTTDAPEQFDVLLWMIGVESEGPNPAHPLVSPFPRLVLFPLQVAIAVNFRGPPKFSVLSHLFRGVLWGTVFLALFPKPSSLKGYSFMILML